MHREITFRDYVGDEICLSVSIYLDDNLKLKPVDGSYLGLFEITSIHISNRNVEMWDNLNFFFEASKPTMKEEAKPILVEKGLFRKGLFKEIVSFRKRVKEELSNY
jgi:hypothetical protein